ncbi:hypothetical protein AMTRI_Chr11g98420 [Amborella trichopoda]
MMNNGVKVFITKLIYKAGDKINTTTQTRGLANTLYIDQRKNNSPLNFSTKKVTIYKKGSMELSFVHIITLLIHRSRKATKMARKHSSNNRLQVQSLVARGS